MRRWIALVIVCWIATTVTPFAGATPLVEESFDGSGYMPGTALNGLNGGTGWAGAWTANSHANFPQDVQAGNLDDYPGLVNAGNHVRLWARGNGSVYSNASRDFADTITDGGQTLWWGFQWGLYGAKLGPGDLLLTGSSSPLFSVTSDQPTDIKFLGTTVAQGDALYTPHLFLVEIDMSGGADAESATCYVDPDLSADPSVWSGTSGTFMADGGLTGIKWDGARAGTGMQADMYFDEIRFDTTWQGAVGQQVLDQQVPEPATFGLATLGLLGLAWHWRRTRRKFDDA